MAQDWNPHHYKVIEVIPGYITVFEATHLTPKVLQWCSGDETTASDDKKKPGKRVYYAHLYNFAFGGSLLQPAHRVFLDSKIIARVLEQGLNVDIGGAGGDLLMARRRAHAVASFFTDERDVEETQVGYYYQVIAPVGPTGRAVDRCVLLNLLEPVDDDSVL